MKEVDLFITEKCNLSCRFCSINADGHSTLKLDMTTIQRFVAYCKENGVSDIHITGGEPTLHENYKEIISLILDSGIDTRLITNGVNLTTNDLNDLKVIGLKNIMVSLDGLEVFHNDVRGPGTYSRTMTTIRNAIALGFYIRVNTVVWNENVNDIIVLMELLDSLGVNTYSIFLGSPVGRAKKMNSLTVVGGKKWLDLLSDLKKDHIANDLKMRVVVERGYALRGGQDIFDYSNIRSCSAILQNYEYLTVRADGNIYPCVFFNNGYQSIGNIHKLDILDFEKNLANSTFYQNLSYVPNECEKCSDSVLCKGGCREFNNQITKTLKDSRCEENNFYPICPLIKMNLLSDEVAPCTDDLDVIEK